MLKAGVPKQRRHGSSFNDPIVRSKERMTFPRWHEIQHTARHDAGCSDGPTRLFPFCFHIRVSCQRDLPREVPDANKCLLNITTPAISLRIYPFFPHFMPVLRFLRSVSPNKTPQSLSRNSRFFASRVFRLAPLHALSCTCRMKC